MQRKNIEIMAPVGSWESLAAAITAGADAVYFGVQGLNMRSASSVNFSLDDLTEIVRICRENSRHSYLTLNTVLYDEDLPYMAQVLDAARDAGVSAVIAADQAAMLAARERGLEVHMSTQVNISNLEAVRFYAQWADVVVLARELTLPQVKKIADGIRDKQIRGPKGDLIRIEMFVHGALCMAVSGKCYLSLHEAWRSANRGECRQLCRRTYDVRDRETGGELHIDNKYIMSPKDLCTLDFLDQMIDAGVAVLKIEGRARGAEYVKTVVETYRQALEMLEKNQFSPENIKPLYQELQKVFNRGFWGGYYLGHRTGELGQWTHSYGSSATRRKVYAAKVTNFFAKIRVAELLLEAAELKTGDEIWFLGEKTGAVHMTIDELRSSEGNVITEGSKGSVVSVFVGDADIRRGDKVYIWEPIGLSESGK